MIESYQLEITRKRRAARIFWIIVFICSFFLYYFFQGYYPDIRLGMNRIFSESGSSIGSGGSDLIRSFGIINVKTIPQDTTIYLGSGAYGNNEKRMSDYGDYSMQISKPGYLNSNMTFRIDREKPFFIEKVSLFPRPTYKELPRTRDIYQITDNTYIIQTASGLIWSGAMMTGRVISSGAIDHIGSKYFRTAAGIMSWETNRFIAADREVANFVETCPQIEWIYAIFSCPMTKSLLTEGGIYMTGILDIRDRLISQSGSISQIVSGSTVRLMSHTGTIDISDIVLIDNVVYRISSGSLLATNGGELDISTPLDTIISATSVEEDIIITGKKKGNKYLLIRRIGDPIDRDRLILLPEHIISTGVRFDTLDGNLIIQTDTGILLIYRGSSELHWLVEGDILSYSHHGVAYRKNGKIWWADWSK